MTPPQLTMYNARNSWALATYLEFESEWLTESTLDTFPWGCLATEELTRTCGQDQLDRRRVNELEVRADA
jgi:hypothetical protein